MNAENANLLNEKSLSKLTNKWRLLAQSKQGLSHQTDSSPCEDYFCAEVVSSDSTQNMPVLMIFVADGAGSAEFSVQGSRICCDTALSVCKKRIDNHIQKQGNNHKNTLITQIFDDDSCHALVAEIQTAIHTHITQTQQTEKSLTMRDFACTFLGVIATNKQTLLLQIGDGAIVVSNDRNSVLEAEVTENNTTLTCPITPAEKAYANMTHFITDEKAKENLLIERLSYQPHQIAVFTDGIERLALTMKDFTPHMPFFKPFFNALQQSTVAETELQTALDTFLSSEAVNERTDDDKTLVLACLQG